MNIQEMKEKYRKLFEEAPPGNKRVAYEIVYNTLCHFQEQQEIRRAIENCCRLLFGVRYEIYQQALEDLQHIEAAKKEV